MSLMERGILIDRGERLGRVDKWFVQNNRVIARIIEEHRARLGSLVVDPADFDTTKMILSEMPLCWSLIEVVKAAPLPDFCLLTPARGYVEVAFPALGYLGYEGVGHSFLINESLDLIVCLTFGQFALPLEEPQHPWEKVNYVRQLAPELVVVSGELAMLRGDKTEITERLGLSYRLRSGYE